MRGLLASLLILAVLACVGCVPMRQGADPVLTRAEQSYDVAFWTVDAVFQIDKKSPDIGALVPGFHEAVNDMRLRAPGIFTSAMNAMDAYRTTRGPENKATMLTALAVVSSLASDADQWLGKVHAAKGGK